MSTSDSSDDEPNELLKEALDTQFMNDAMFNGSNANKHLNNIPKSHVTETPPSLRPFTDKTDQFDTSLNVTPGFQQYVAKELSKVLDKKLEKLLTTTVAMTTSNPPQKHKKSGIKLFRDSPKYVKIDKHEASSRTNCTNNRPYRKLEEDEDDRLKCSEVAISPDDILSKKEIQNWSTRTKNKVFVYRKDKSGTLTSVE